MRDERARYEQGQRVARGLVHAFVTVFGLLVQSLGPFPSSALLAAIHIAHRLLVRHWISADNAALLLCIAFTFLSLALSFLPGVLGRSMLRASLFATSLNIGIGVFLAGAATGAIVSSIPLAIALWLGWRRLSRLPMPVAPTGVCQRCGYSMSGLPRGAPCPECNQLGAI